MAANDLTFSLAWADVDPSLLPAEAREVGSEAFRRAVIAFLGQQYETAGGKVRVVFNDMAETVDVQWSAVATLENLRERAMVALRRGEANVAVPLLKALIAHAPDDLAHTCNLAMVYSDQGRLAEATALLQHVLESAPNHIDALVALGVVRVRAGDTDTAVKTLRHAVRLAPGNSYASQNLGACLLKQGRASEAIDQFRASLRSEPTNVQAQLGLGQALESDGQLHEADGVYLEVLAKSPQGLAADIAKEGRTRIAHALLRRTEDERPDVVLYCLDALKRFQAMSHEEVEGLALEIAILGTKGLDINDPEQKYTLRRLPGSFSGLQLLSLMYVAFKRVRPEADINADFSREYAKAMELFGREPE